MVLHQEVKEDLDQAEVQTEAEAEVVLSQVLAEETLADNLVAVQDQEALVAVVAEEVVCQEILELDAVQEGPQHKVDLVEVDNQEQYMFILEPQLPMQFLQIQIL